MKRLLIAVLLSLAAPLCLAQSTPVHYSTLRATQNDLSMSTPGAPTTALVSGSGCANGTTYRLYVTWQNASGETAVSPASTDQPGGLVKSIQVTRPTIPSNAVSWRAYFTSSAESHAKVRACGASGAISTTAAATTTATCVCSTSGQDFVLTANQTHALSATDPFTYQPWQIRQVCMDGCPYSTIAAALASYSDQAANKRYLIDVGLGDYREDISAKSYTEIRGRSRRGTRIVGLSSPSGTLQIPADVTEFFVSNLTLAGRIPMSAATGAVGRTRLGFYDMDFGINDASRFGVASIDCAKINGDQHDIFYQNIGCFSAFDGFECGSNDVCWFNNVQMVLDTTLASTGNARAFYNSVANVGQQMFINEARIKIVCDKTTTGCDAVAMRMAATSGGSPTQTTIMSMSASAVDIIGTSSGSTKEFRCFDVLGAGSSSTYGSKMLINGVDCNVSSASSSASVAGLVSNSGGSHSDLVIDWHGGKIELAGTGGATPTKTDVISNDTTAGLVLQLSGVVHSGAYSGSGPISAGDTRLGKFGTRAEIPVESDLVANTCTVGEIKPDNGGANHEWCWCWDNGGTKQWACITATTTNGPTN